MSASRTCKPFSIFQYVRRKYFSHSNNQFQHAPTNTSLPACAKHLDRTDVHYWQHGRIGQYVVNDPIELGHDTNLPVSSKNVEKTSRTSRLVTVTLEPGVGGNTCETCRSGRYNLCSSMRFAATPPYDGTLSTFYCLPEECCFKILPLISLREAALVEPLGIAIHCCGLAGNLQGKTTAIFGAGPIGLVCGAVARAFGATSVVVTDVLRSRLDTAKSFGATGTYMMQSQSPAANAAEILVQAGLYNEVDVVIDATGAEPCIECGIAVLKESFRYGPGDFRLAIDLLNSRRMRVDGLITHTFPFSDSELAFNDVHSREVIKTIIYGPIVDEGLACWTSEKPVQQP